MDENNEKTNMFVEKLIELDQNGYLLGKNTSYLKSMKLFDYCGSFKIHSDLIDSFKDDIIYFNYKHHGGKEAVLRIKDMIDKK